MNPVIAARFTDNDAFSHWAIVNTDTGETIIDDVESIVRQRDQLLEALEECLTELKHVQVFVTTREKIKQPEGYDLFLETINYAIRAINEVKGGYNE